MNLTSNLSAALTKIELACTGCSKNLRVSLAKCMRCRRAKSFFSEVAAFLSAFLISFQARPAYALQSWQKDLVRNAFWAMLRHLHIRKEHCHPLPSTSQKKGSCLDLGDKDVTSYVRLQLVCCFIILSYCLRCLPAAWEVKHRPWKFGKGNETSERLYEKPGKKAKRAKEGALIASGSAKDPDARDEESLLLHTSSCLKTKY